MLFASLFTTLLLLTVQHRFLIHSSVQYCLHFTTVLLLTFHHIIIVQTSVTAHCSVIPQCSPQCCCSNFNAVLLFTAQQSVIVQSSTQCYCSLFTTVLVFPAHYSFTVHCSPQCYCSLFTTVSWSEILENQAGDLVGFHRFVTCYSTQAWLEYQWAGECCGWI